MYRGWTKKMETAVKHTHFFINMELGHHLPVTQPVSFLEQTRVSSEQSLVQYCTTLLLVAGEIMEGICFSPCSLKLTSGSMIFKVGECAIQRRCWSASSCSSNQDWTHLAVCMANHLEKLHHCQETTPEPLDAPGYLKCSRSHWQ